MQNRSDKRPPKRPPRAEDFPLSPTEAAKIAGLSPRSMIRYAAMKRIPHFRETRGKRQWFRFREADVYAFIESQRNGEFVAIVEEPKEPERYSSRHANPAIDLVIDQHPELFRKFTDGDWQELESSFGDGGALTEEGVVALANHINRVRPVRRKFEALTRSDQFETLADIIDSMYKRTISK